MTPRVSVVVPAFDNAAFIEETIASILAQSFTDFELVISDHGSTDGTWESVRQFADDPRVRLMQVPRGGGAVTNWTTVTSTASGELLKLVCGDDLLYPTALAEQVAAFDRHPEAVMVASRRDIIDADGRPILRDRGLAGMSGLVAGDVAVRRAVTAGTNVFGEPVCVLIRRSALAAAGGWDARWPYLIDQATYTRVLRRGPLVAHPATLAAFRVSPGQWSVALAGSQAAHARQFHRAVLLEHDGALTGRDRLIGDARATALGVGRKAVYTWIRVRDRVGRPARARRPHAAYPGRDTALDRIAE